ncbi:MAG: prepilin-type N-terminal cleavage/methylation domain-containing protein [Acutalibacteraceae bacterium]|nr:prepilin-type N-terminal cleavage/methylation domain-containing protein [Acutalibacteraceae bacterium]
MTKAITKNSKKGFTLVELVVVIAILAILAAIAIPVVNSIINTASRNGALSDAQTIELAVKECQADIAARNDEVYAGQKIKTPLDAAADGMLIPKASTNHADIELKHVAVVKGIENAFKVVTYNGVDYAPYWDKDADRCVYLSLAAKDKVCAEKAPLDSEDKDVDGAVKAYANAGNCVALVAITDGKATDGVLTTADTLVIEAL